MWWGINEMIHCGKGLAQFLDYFANCTINNLGLLWFGAHKILPWHFSLHWHCLSQRQARLLALPLASMWVIPIPDLFPFFLNPHPQALILHVYVPFLSPILSQTAIQLARKLSHFSLFPLSSLTHTISLPHLFFLFVLILSQEFIAKPLSQAVNGSFCCRLAPHQSVLYTATRFTKAMVSLSFLIHF